MSEVLAAKVAVEHAAYSFDREFDYLVPARLREEIAAGKRVLVPFGRGNRRRQGIVTALHQIAPDDKLKPLLAVLDSEPVLSEELLDTARFMKERCFCTLYDAVKTMLPAGINYKVATVYGVKAEDGAMLLDEEKQRIYNYLFQKRKPVRLEKILDDFGLADSAVLDEMTRDGFLYKSEEAFRRVNDAVTKMTALAPNCDISAQKLTPKQQSVVELLEVTGAVSAKEIRYFTGVSAAVLDALVKKGVIYFFDEEVFRIDSRDADEDIPPLVLSDEQQAACDNLLADYRDPQPKVSLLYGVTGSGKTSVFMKLIERVMDDGRGVIVMVPEISLTPQFVALFTKRFGDRIAVFHSALSLGERLDEYKRVKKGLAQIVIGTRSAVFAPFEKLGLVIMDEEQEYSYKSESAPRYHARDIAMYRVAKNHSLLVLSSATPSVESFYYAQTGRYSLNVLKRRYGTAVLPDVITADMNEEVRSGNVSSVTCPHCSISLTYHSRNNRLMCHYCGYSVPFTGECPACHGVSLRLGGTGTQKAERDITDIFPNARVLRMDTDAASSKSSYERMIAAFSRGDYDILVGTQMVAKGLDFPNVTLVGVLNTDQALYADDYRNYERAFSLLTQVVGRSGRGKEKGSAVIQTYTPDNLIIAMAARQDYDAFYNTEIKMREMMLYPPFADICLVGFVGENQPLTLRAAAAFLDMFAKDARKDYPAMPLRILGPSPASVVKVSNKYRYKLIIKCRNSKDFRALLSSVLLRFGESKEYRNVTAYADMNALVC